MPLLIAVLLFTWLISRTIGHSVTDNNLAKKGIVSPRMQSRHGDSAAGKVAKYGFTDHLKDNWSDAWSRRTEAMVAARDAKAAARADGTVDPTAKVGWRDRWAAAKGAITRGATDTAGAINRVSASTPGLADRPDGGTSPTADAAPVSTPAPTPATTPDPPAAATGTAPAIGRASVSTPTSSTDPDGPIETATVVDTVALPQPSKEPSVSVPTGEAVNYETTCQVLRDLIKDAQQQVDSASAAQRDVVQAKASVDHMQATYRASADAAGEKLDHQTALNLDGTTLGHAGTTVDSLPPNAVDNLFEAAEALEADITDRLHQAETALASLEAELKHIEDTYGDAHNTVAGNLGGDSRFLDSGGGQGGGNPIPPVGGVHPPSDGRTHDLRATDDDPAPRGPQPNYEFGPDTHPVKDGQPAQLTHPGRSTDRPH